MRSSGNNWRSDGNYKQSNQRYAYCGNEDNLQRDYAQAEEEILCLAWNQSGSTLAGGYNGGAKLWNMGESTLFKSKTRLITNF